MPSSFAAVRDGLDAVLRDRGLRRSTPEDTARSLLLGAAASAALETGVPVDPDDLAAGAGDATARAALRLSSELLALVPVWKRSPVQVLARLHALAAAGSVPEAELGRPVDPSRLTALAGLLARPTQAPGLVVASLVHAEIAAAGAFETHNGVVARAAERLLLVVKGVDPASVIVPEAGHADDPAGYRQALAAYDSGDPTGVHQWLLYASTALTRAGEHSPLAR